MYFSTKNYIKNTRNHTAKYRWTDGGGVKVELKRSPRKQASQLITTQPLFLLSLMQVIPVS
jgi:hypothetical protein